MPAPSLSQANALPDLMAAHKYMVRFGEIPGYSGDTTNLALLCFNANLPGRSNEMWDAPLPGGHVRKFVGRNMMPRIISFSFYETINAEVHRALHEWMEFMTGLESGNSSGYSNEYAIPIEVVAYDSTGAESLVYNIQHVVPSDIPDTPLSAESSAGMQVNVQFSYETYTKTDVASR